MNRFGFLFAFLFLFGATAVQAQSMADGVVSQAQNGYGQAMAVHGDQLFAGEPMLMHTPGIVYVYDRDGGEWVEQTRIEAEDGEVGNRFGNALATDGQTLLVGAPGAEPFGAVYVFERAGEGWTQAARLAPEDTVQSFGASVAYADGVALVGAPAQDEQAGAAFVFEREGDSWSQAAELPRPDAGEQILFGGTLAIDAGQLLVGAPGAERGTVYTYRRDGDEWAQAQQISPPALDDGARFGTALQARDGYALIGAARQGGGAGAVFSFEYDAEGEAWSAVGQLTPFDGMSQLLFGAALAFDGTNAWIGAPGANQRAGALYRYARDAETGNWTTATRMSVPEAQRNDRLGTVVVAGDGIVVASMAGADHGAGRAVVFADEDGTGNWAMQTDLAGDPEVGLAALTGEEVRCEEGEIGPFACENVDLLSFLPTREIGGERGVRLNDIWGWVDPETGREIALVGRMDGMAFVDITNPTQPVYLGELPLTEGARPNSWRDMKVYKDHMFVVADNAGEHGMQVFDLTQLRDIENPPQTFTETALYTNINSAHNMVLNEETGYGYIVGASGGGETCGGGLHMVDLEDPTNPEFMGCFADTRTGRTGTGYTHDAQCIVYEGPDERYHGREICIGANETALSIADVTDKDDPRAISVGTYPDYGYVHQGWLTEDQRYFFVNDELDELNGIVDNTRTLIWDLSDLEDPQLIEEYFHETTASTHNLYIKDNLMYQSNYTSGLRVLDISDPENPVEVGHFDTAPHQSGPGFGGSWGNYPYFESGTIVVTSGSEGVFFVRPQPLRPVSELLP